MATGTIKVNRRPAGETPEEYNKRRNAEYDAAEFAKYGAETEEEKDARYASSGAYEEEIDLDNLFGGDPNAWDEKFMGGQYAGAGGGMPGYGSKLAQAWDAAGGDPSKMLPGVRDAWNRYQNRGDALSPLEYGTTPEGEYEMGRSRSLGRTEFDMGDINDSSRRQDDYLDMLSRSASGEDSQMSDYFSGAAASSEGDIQSVGASTRGGYNAGGVRGTQNAVSGVRQGMAGQRALAMEEEKALAEQMYGGALGQARGSAMDLGFGARGQDIGWDTFAENQALEYYGRGAQDKLDAEKAAATRDALEKSIALNQREVKLKQEADQRAKDNRVLGMFTDIGTGVLTTLGAVAGGPAGAAAGAGAGTAIGAAGSGIVGTGSSASGSASGAANSAGNPGGYSSGASIMGSAPDFYDEPEIKTIGQYGQRTPRGTLSDINAKKSFKPADRDLDEFLDELGPQTSWSYKDPKYGDQGRRTGPMAQDIERSKVGKSLVKEIGGVKRVDYAKAIPTMLASQARINQRLREMEARGGLSDERLTYGPPPEVIVWPGSGIDREPMARERPRPVTRESMARERPQVPAGRPTWEGMYDSGSYHGDDSFYAERDQPFLGANYDSGSYHGDDPFYTERDRAQKNADAIARRR